jgi:type IV pilus assembly protein PilY1
MKLVLSLLLLSIMAIGAQAAPPVLAIASEPLAALCRPATAPASGEELDGAALVRTASRPGQPGTLFQSTMNTTDWGGRFARYTMSAGTAGGTSALSAAWEAGGVLTGDANRAPLPMPAQRKIYTAIVQPDGALAMAPFEWTALSPEQRSQLDPTQDGAGPQRLAWLRGERSDEGTLLRARGSVLGNSVHATPVYVGSPAHPLAPARPDMLYLGANDGMLHAFNAADGSELFAYVPAALFGTLHQLTSPNYVHRAYVDGPAQAADVSIAGAMRTVLVSGMGGGAQGVFALDITDPANFAAQGGVLWEFTDRQDPLMGNVTSAPQLAKLRVASRGAAGIYRHFAVVASGINNYADDGYASATGDGALFLLALDKPRNAPWRLNDNYYRLTTPIADATRANALHAPVLVAERDGAARFAYGGDLQGNLWRFDLAAGPPWEKAVGPGPESAPLFIARDAAGKRQPITQQPQLAYASNGGYLVLFGTGKLIEQPDRSAASFASQTYYGIHDSLRTPAEIVTGRRQLARRELQGDPASARLTLVGEPLEADSMGWYVDLLQSSSTGERSIDSGVLRNGALVFNTVLPTTQPCSPTPSRTYVLNALTGLTDGRSVTVRLPPTPAVERPIVGELSASYAARPLLLPTSTITSPRSPTGAMRVEQEFDVVAGARAGTLIGTVRTQARAGRLSWREIANWRQLHEATP